MSESESFYSTTGSEEGRFLILSDKEQVMPSTRCKVTEATMQKSGTSGKEYPILCMEDEEGNTYRVCAWKRDVLQCIKQWGGVKPTDWGYVSFIASPAGRYVIVPSKNQLPDAEEVRA